MKSTVWRVCALALLALFVAVAATPLAFAEKKQQMTVTGVVKKFDVYKNKVRSVYIKDEEKGDYLVMRSTDMGKEVLKQVGATITATGYVREALRDKDFEFIIDVLEFEIVDAAAEPDAKPDP